MSLRFALAALLTALSAAPAFAQPVRLIGEFRDWTAYSAAEGAGALCFMMSTARETAPEPDGFTAAHLYITSRPREGLRDEFNLIAGFNFAPDSPASVSVGGTSFPLFTERDAAWLLDPAQSGGLGPGGRGDQRARHQGQADLLAFGRHRRLSRPRGLLSRLALLRPCPIWSGRRFAGAAGPC
jgi:hypothetical protein